GSWQGANIITTSAQTQLGLTNGGFIEIVGAKLEVGSQPTAYRRRDVATEILVAQRFYEKSYDYGTASGDTGGLGYDAAWVQATQTAAPFLQVRFKVTKRCDPTVTLYSPGTGTVGKASVSGGTGDVT